MLTLFIVLKWSASHAFAYLQVTIVGKRRLQPRILLLSIASGLSVWLTQVMPTFANTPQFIPSWDALLNTPNKDNVEDTTTFDSKHIYTTGYTLGALTSLPNIGGEDAFLVQYDAAGKANWTIQFGTTADDDPEGVTTDHNGNMIVSGYTRGDLGGSNLGNEDAFIAKFDPNGNQLWLKQIGSKGDDDFEDLGTDLAGNIYAAGHTTGNLGGQSNGGEDAILAKYDPNGNLLWLKQFGTSKTDKAKDVKVDNQGNAYVVGTTQGVLSGINAGGYDRFTTKFDPVGQQIWIQQNGTTANDFAEGVAVEADGSTVYVTGFIDGQQRDAYVAAAQGNNGVQQWYQVLGNTKDNETCKAIELDGLGNLYAACYTNNLTGKDNLLAKYTISGLLLFSQVYGTSGSDVSKGIGIDKLGNIYTAGYTISTTSRRDYSGHTYKFMAGTVATPQKLPSSTRR